MLQKDIAEGAFHLLVPVGTAVAWLAGILPPLAALASILWICWQWWHSKPMVEWRKRRGRK